MCAMWVRRAAPMVMVVGAVVALAACGMSGSPVEDDGSDGASTLRRAVESGRSASATDLALEPGDTGRFVMRVERGIEGAMMVDFTVSGAYDRRVPATELVVDLWAMARPGVEAGIVAWTPGAPTEMVIRQIDHEVFVDTRRHPIPWVVFTGPDPLGAHDMLATYEPGRLLDVLASNARDVTTSPGGELDGVATVKHSGWLDGAAHALLGSGDEFAPSRETAIGGVGLDEVLSSIYRFDVWVGVDDGVARRLVIEWDLDALAELALRLDGTDENIHRARYRTEVEWFDIGAPVVIDEPPPHLVGVIDPAALVE